MLLLSYSSTFATVAALVAGALAFGVLFQGARSISQRAFIGGMALFAVESALTAYTGEALTAESLVFSYNCSLVVLALLPIPWVLFSVTYARGDAAEAYVRHRLPLGFLAIAGLVLPLVFFSRLSSPLLEGEPPRLVYLIGPPGKALHLWFMLASLLVLVNLERTLRGSVGTMRWRIKYMIMGLGVLFVARIYTSSQTFLFSQVNPALAPINSCALLMCCALLLRSVFRAGHFDVSVYPSQSLLHNSFTVLLAGIYLMIVGVLAKLVSNAGGAAAFQLNALLVLVALVVLTVITLSDRVRLHLRRFISRHFQRPLYDYRTVWRSFTHGTARCLDEKELCSSLAKLVSDVFQALSVTIWLVDEKRENLSYAASTSLLPAAAGTEILRPPDSLEVIRALTAHPEPIDIDASREFWASALRRAHPDEFQKGGNRVCVPMIAGGELLGVLAVGDRVAGLSFSIQDLDLLKSVSDQAAASLLNVQLAHKLSQAKQLEAFQAMSAFFVHDLKNTASTLSLMLQNLPVHYNDPKFREDALRGISKTVGHINELISRLSVLRQELAIQPVEADLNQLIIETLKAQEFAQGIQFQRNLQPLPKVRMDAGQIQKVLTNLVLNAKEAIGADGHIEIETSQRNGWAIISVRDNGCGMPPEFIHTRLYRPFQTTKKKGIGIGMFHCKMIVEAHRGRIEVESQQGKGTVFRVLLPVAA